MNYYYLYLIKFEDGRFYIGSRQSKIKPEDDVKYWGSPVTHKHLWKDTSLSKTKHILKVCDNFEEMYELEPRLIREAWKKYPDLCLNMNATGAFHPSIIHRELTEEERFVLSYHAKQKFIINPKLIEIARETGKRCAEQGLGIHAESFKPRRRKTSKENGLKLKEEKKGIFRSEEERIEWCVKGGKKLGDLNVKLNRGIFNPELQKHRKEWCSIAGRTSHKKFKFISPQGKIYEGTNYTKWCRDMGFSHQGFCALITGRQKKTQGGWRLG